MHPSITRILQGIVADLDHLILPQLKGPQAESAGQCARMLLDHVIHRLENEGPSLHADSLEKRQVLQEIARLLTATPATAEHPQLQSLVCGIREGIDRIPPTPRFISFEEITAENDRLKALMETAITVLHERRSELDSKAYDDMRKTIRHQLRSQLNRELAAIEPLQPISSGADLIGGDKNRSVFKE